MTVIQQFKNFATNIFQKYTIEDLVEPEHFSPAMISYHDPLCYITQQYNQIAGAILHHHALKRCQTIVMTSPQPGDGKSTTVSNVAICLARNHDKKVLLVDGDWRRPQLGNFFKSESLTLNESLDLEHGKLVFHTKLENLDVLHVTKNQKVDIDWLDLLIDSLSDFRSEYDYVLIDSAPIMKVTDAALLGKQSDGLMLLVRAQDTSAKMIESAKEILTNHDAPLKATILVNLPSSVDVYNYLLNPHYRRYYSDYYSEYA